MHLLKSLVIRLKCLFHRLNNFATNNIMNTENFRQYEESNDRVRTHYRNLRTNQTYGHVLAMKDKYLKFDKEMSLWDVIDYLTKHVDQSDPDISLPNAYHLFQTAEAIRKDGHPDWLQLVGLIHDCGKILFKWGNDEDGTSVDSQWGVTGDTFIVGCEIPDTCVFPEYNKDNPDMRNSRYNTKYGVYFDGCGLDNCHCSWGHAEYMYHMLRYNKSNIPEEGLYIIRYHSLYPWHTMGEYTHLMNEKDHKYKKYVQLFNKYDLYTKCGVVPDINGLKEYYTCLIAKYFDSDRLYW